MTGGPDAIEGLRAAFWEHMDEKSRTTNQAFATKDGTMPLVGQKLLAFLDKPGNKAVAERLYRDSPEHLENLRKIAETLRATGLSAPAKARANPSGTALMQKTPPVTLAEIGSKGYQAQIGRAGWWYIGAYLAGKAARGLVNRQTAAAFDQLLDKALLDPNEAAMLLKENNPANRAALARGARTWMGTNVNLLVTALTDEDTDETKDAITRP